jgi:hypothetical protein
MIATLTLAAALQSPCVHHKHHSREIQPEQSCVSRVYPYPGWQPRDNEDSLSSGSNLEPLTIGPLTKYLTMTTIEPCHVWSSAGGLSWQPTGAALVRAPEIDPRGGIESVTLLALALIVFTGRKRK